ncbi:MAG: sodium/proline symporter, partial [Planctomycetaceae bacterium]|nr:sodium/proline symporter [Planctomycetaceae bacterium]
MHKRLHRAAERTGAVSYADVLASWDGQQRPAARISIAALTILFLITYAAAQFLAGSKALNVLLGWPQYAGGLMGCVLVILYCFAGGIRASIWTDAAQSFVMMFAMAVLLIAASLQLGGPRDVWENLRQQDPELVHWIPRDLRFGFVMYLLGMTFGGFGVAGQPHILVRFMAIRSVHEIHRARTVYFLWFIPFFAASIAVGLYARALMPDLVSSPVAAGLTAHQATELAMPEMARRLLPDILVGLTLAGLFSATMSTADSQILVCSGAITQDIQPRWKNSYLATKLATVAVTALALGIALFAGQGVFSLVLIAWSALGAGLGPALILRLLRVQVSSGTNAAMMFTGVVTVILWNLLGYDADVFKLMPGMLASFAVWLIAASFTATS